MRYALGAKNLLAIPERFFRSRRFIEKGLRARFLADGARTRFRVTLFAF